MPQTFSSCRESPLILYHIKIDTVLISCVVYITLNWIGHFKFSTKFEISLRLAQYCIWCCKREKK